MTEDRILLIGMTFYGYHGAEQAEREIGQRFVVDVELWRDLSIPGSTDSLSDTVNYSSVFRTVKSVIEGPPRNLLEAVAESVASRILAEYDVEAVKVILKKPAAPIGGSILDYAAVEVMRRREG